MATGEASGTAKRKRVEEEDDLANAENEERNRDVRAKKQVRRGFGKIPGLGEVGRETGQRGKCIRMWPLPDGSLTSPR